MNQGDDSPPGERRCTDCDRRWYSAALLRDDDATCPECGGTLEASSAED